MIFYKTRKHPHFTIPTTTRGETFKHKKWEISMRHGRTLPLDCLSSKLGDDKEREGWDDRLFIQKCHLSSKSAINSHHAKWAREEKRVLEVSRGMNIIFTTWGWRDKAARLFSQDWAVEYNFSLEPSHTPSCSTFQHQRVLFWHFTGRQEVFLKATKSILCKRKTRVLTSEGRGLP